MAATGRAARKAAAAGVLFTCGDPRVDRHPDTVLRPKLLSFPCSWALYYRLVHAASSRKRGLKVQGFGGTKSAGFSAQPHQARKTEPAGSTSRSRCVRISIESLPWPVQEYPPLFRGFRRHTEVYGKQVFSVHTQFRPQNRALRSNPQKTSIPTGPRSHFVRLCYSAGRSVTSGHQATAQWLVFTPPRRPGFDPPLTKSEERENHDRDDRATLHRFTSFSRSAAQALYYAMGDDPDVILRRR